MFWPWTAATGNGLTFLTFRGTLRWLKRLAAFLLTWLLTCYAERICNLLQGRVVENISKRCGGFLRKLSLRGCLGVGDSALRWDLGKPGTAEAPARTGSTNVLFFPSRTFAQNCRNIELLSLNGCTKITDRYGNCYPGQTYKKIAAKLWQNILFCSTCNSLSKFCPKLKHLDLSSCTSITNLSLKALRWERSLSDLVW